MPRFDGTGPDGMGPITGRGCGECRGRRGFCGMRGRRRFRGGCFMDSSISQSVQDRTQMLENYKKELEAEIALLDGELKKTGKDKE